MSNIVMQPQYISEPQYQDDQYLLKSSKYKAAKGFLTCLLILPILFFITCLVLFIILICYQQSSTVAVDHALSVTEQFGQDVNAQPWNNAVVKTVACATTTPNTLTYANFQGIQSGKISEVTLGKQYSVVDDESSCTGKCKVEKGISTQGLIYSFNTANRICYSNLAFEDYIVKGTAACTGDYPVTCAESKLCLKTGKSCPLTTISKLVTTAVTADSFPVDTQGINAKTTDENKKFIIGMVGGYTLPCRNPEYLDVIPTQKINYPLLGIGYTGCDEYGTYEEAQVVDFAKDLSFETLLKSNGIKTDGVNTESPYFYDFIKDIYVGKQYKMFVKYRPDVKTEAVCRNTGFEQLGVVRQYLNSTNRALFIYTVTGIVLSSLGLLFWLVLIGATYTAKTRKTKKGSSQILKVVHLLAIILAILLIVLYIHYKTAVDEDMSKIQKIQTAFNNAKSASCYNNAGTWNSAFEKVRSFINVALKLSKPFIITFFIIGIVYLVLVLIVLAATKAKGVSPCMPPYLNYAH